MIVHENMIQGSEEWENIRLGRATASQASMIFTPTGKLSASRVKYARRLARECRMKDPMEFQGNKYTDWGNEHESEARAVFEKETGKEVHEVGFCTRADRIIGCSPDGLIKKDGEWAEGLEIKCPQVDKHGEYLLEGELPPEYKLQVHWSMATTGLNAWWFMSYFPDVVSRPTEDNPNGVIIKTNPLILKIERDEFTEKVSEAMDQFIIDYRDIRNETLDALYGEKKDFKLEVSA